MLENIFRWQFFEYFPRSRITDDLAFLYVMVWCRSEMLKKQCFAYACLIASVYRYQFFSHIDVILRWGHNECDCVSNHQPRTCLRKHFLRHRSKKTSKLRVPALGAERPVRQKMFPFHDDILIYVSVVYKLLAKRFMKWYALVFGG